MHVYHRTPLFIPSYPAVYSLVYTLVPRCLFPRTPLFILSLAFSAVDSIVYHDMGESGQRGGIYDVIN